MIELNSKNLVEKINFATKAKAAELVDRGHDPHLAVVMVGNDPESAKYVGLKSKRGKELGINVSFYHLKEDEGYDAIADTIKFLNEDEEINSIILQLPLPSKFKKEEVEKILKMIEPKKDVDGLSGAWMDMSKEEIEAQLSIDFSGGVNDKGLVVPPMALGIYSLLKEYKIEMENKKIVVVGRGKLVGQPAYNFFQKLGYDIQMVHTETDHIFDVTKEADILITGTGQANLITYQWIKEGATVIDCSMDLHNDSIEQVAGAVSPAVGGIGPLTVAWLLHNVVVVSQ